MKKLLSLTVIALLTTTLFAQTTWKVDPMHSKLTFSTTHLGISDVAGLFRKFDVNVVTSKTDFSDAIFELSVDINSINTEVEMRDNHLKSPDFFNAEKYPKMTFKSTSIKKVDDNKYTLIGDLTLMDITKPVTMDLWYRGTTTNPMSKADVSGFQLTGSIKRSDFNLGSGFPSTMISDIVKIIADGEFGKN